MKFEKWMIGEKVEEISTGDCGVVVNNAHPYEGCVYVRWSSGDEKGLTLWIDLEKVRFVREDIKEHRKAEVIKESLGKIEELLSKIKEMI